MCIVGYHHGQCTTIDGKVSSSISATTFRGRAEEEEAEKEKPVEWEENMGNVVSGK